jgi:predicted NBD/HSP70 family sugar kinase
MNESMNERVNPKQAPMLDYDALVQSNLREKDRVKIFILKYIQEEGNASRKMVVEALSMRPSTVSKSILEMIEDGILKELPHKANSGRGRPEWFLELSKDRFWVISFSIMSMTLIASIVNFAGGLVENVVVKLDRDLDAIAMTNTFNGLIKDLQRKVPSGTTLLGYGFAVPGLIDKQANVWRMVSRFPKMKNLKFEQVFGFREGNVFFERNIDTILKHCLLSQPAAQSGTALLLHWGYGIAISCSMEGNLIQSNGGLFGEIGHWTVNLENETTETIESIAAVPKLIKLYHWNDSLDEVSIQKSVEGGFVDSMELQRIINIIIRVLRNLHLSFFPDTIYILSPFIDTQAILHITEELTQLLKPFAINSPKVVALEYSSHSESLGIANTIFSRTIQPHLVARW